MRRREFLTGAVGLGALALTGDAGLAAASNGPNAKRRRRPLALVYRGPASIPGCPEAVASLLATGPHPLEPVFCGPKERVRLSARALSHAALYAQPGGGSLDPAWEHMHVHADAIRAFVRRGGRYLGFCLGGYLAGRAPGYALLPGDTDEYVGSRGATVHTLEDTTIDVCWRGRHRRVFFQDGPIFEVRRKAVDVLATYDNGFVAALACRYGRGAVGVVGPHPEADRSWFDGAGLRRPRRFAFDLGHDLVATTMRV